MLGPHAHDESLTHCSRVLKDLKNSGAFRPGAVRLAKYGFGYLMITHIFASLYWLVADAMYDETKCIGVSTHDVWGVCNDLRLGSLVDQWACTLLVAASRAAHMNNAIVSYA